MRGFVQGVGVRVTRQERQSMGRTLGKGHLQAVVVGLVQVRQSVDLSQVRELAKQRPLGLRGALACIARVASYSGATKRRDRPRCENIVLIAPVNLAQRSPCQ